MGEDESVWLSFPEPKESRSAASLLTTLTRWDALCEGHTHTAGSLWVSMLWGLA